MKVSELFRRLSLSEFSNLSWAGEGNGTITTAKQPMIVQYADDGLLRLYSRYLLKQEEVMLEQLSWLNEYKIDSKHGLFNPARPASVPGYILDKPGEPFPDDIIKILKVFGPYGCELPLNDEVCGSLATPQSTVLQISCPVDRQVISVVYQARHVPLTIAPDAEITLPDVLYPALFAYISSKVFSNMNGAEHVAKSGEQGALFDAICEEVVDMDLVSSSISNSLNRRFGRGGWR
jgi:hypothetical protein